MGCLHKQVEPVTLISGETVAQLCTNCLARLDPAFGCPSCDYEDIATVGEGVIARILTRHCDRHLEYEPGLNYGPVPWALG